MRQQLRRTGISILGDLPWGAHVCLFYETRDDLIETLVAFFKAGLESNEFCIWAVTDPLTVEDASATLAASIPDFARHLSDGRIELVRGYDWYMSRDLKKVTDGWLEMKDTALARGFAGMRASGNAFWLETEFRDDFLAYEQELDAAISGCPMLVLCTYSLVQSRAADLYEVARAHGITAARQKGHWEIVEALADTDTHSLTLREVEVLSWVARGKSAWEIGQILGIVKRTVDEHAGSATRKLGAANRTEAIAIALQRRIIELDRSPGPARQFRHAH